MPRLGNKQKKGFAPKRETLICTAVFVVGRAGFEPATNGLKVLDAMDSETA